MTDVGIIGYEKLINGTDFPDLVISLPREMNHMLGLDYVSQVTLDDAVGNQALADEDIAKESIKKLLEPSPQVVHMANYRDPDTGRSVDRLLLEMLRQKNVPVLLTTGGLYGINLAREIGIACMETPFKPVAYAKELHKLAGTYHA